jgi:syntaxin 1B/2/3
MEMSSYPSGSQGGYGGGNGGMGGGASDPNAILNECRDIDRGIDTIDRNLEQLKMLQQRSLDDADSSAGSMTNRQLDQLSSETMDLYRALTDRVRKVKSNREAQQPKNAPQINRIDRRLKTAINSYQQVESTFRKKNQDQMARQYRIVRPEADESEVRAAVEDMSGGQVFSQALMQSSRLVNAQRALSAVQDRHQQIQKIERQMVELAQLFQDMDTLIIQQEVAVAQIEQKAEEVVDNLDKGNDEVQTAVTTARATRRKKWWCLAICSTYTRRRRIFPLFFTRSLPAWSLLTISLSQSSSSSSSSPLCSSTSPSIKNPPSMETKTITTTTTTTTTSEAWRSPLTISALFFSERRFLRLRIPESRGE